VARYTGPKCKLCRRENVKLFLKGERCYTDKCAISIRPYPPGQHGQARTKISEYGLQLREKQKMRRIYGVNETQFRLTYAKASRKKGVTGENLLALLETRFDNVIHKLGFASSKDEARQFIRHGHYRVNGRRVDIPSQIIKVGDVITVSEGMKGNPHVLTSLSNVDKKVVPQWLELDAKQFKGVLKSLPLREDVTLPVQEQLVVELYSK